MSRMEPPLDPATLAADVGGSEAQVDFLLQKYCRAAERNRCLRRYRKTKHPEHRRKGTDVPSVYLGRGGRSRKLARQVEAPSPAALTATRNAQADAKILPAHGSPLEAWIVDASAGMDTDEASPSPSEPPEAGSIEKPMQALKEVLQQSSTKAVVAVLPVLLAIELLLTRDSGYSAVFLESEVLQRRVVSPMMEQVQSAGVGLMTCLHHQGQVAMKAGKGRVWLTPGDNGYSEGRVARNMFGLPMDFQCNLRSLDEVGHQDPSTSSRGVYSAQAGGNPGERDASQVDGHKSVQEPFGVDPRTGGTSSTQNVDGQNQSKVVGDEDAMVGHLHLLVQGMRQLQQLQIAKKETPESETMKGNIELPPMPELGDAAVEFNDWLYVAEQMLGALTDSASTWLGESLRCAREAYDRYQRASAMDRLTIVPVLTATLKDKKWYRLERRVLTLLLSAMPRGVKEDTITHRVENVTSVLYRLHVLYQPGGTAERTAILGHLSGSSGTEDPAEVVAKLRKWRRYLARADEMGIAAPDASILLKGLDLTLQKVLERFPEVKFRLDLARNDLRLSSAPTQESVLKYYQHALAELQQVAPSPKRQAESTRLKGATTTTGAGTGGSTSAPGSPTRSKGPCKFFASDNGCKRGSSCPYTHEFTSKAERKQRCWTCGANNHRQSECPTTGGGGKGKGKTNSGAPASSTSSTTAPNSTLAKAQSVDTELRSTTSTADNKDNNGATASTTSGPSTTTNDEASAHREEMRQLLQEANSMLSKIKLMGMKVDGVDPTREDLELFFLAAGATDERMALLDSGASHPFRQAVNELELQQAKDVSVELADGQKVDLLQTRTGTLLNDRALDQSPIVPLGSLVQQLGCTVNWSRRQGLRVNHPVHGDIAVRMRGNCPMIDELEALKLISEIEEKNLAQLREATAKGLWSQLSPTGSTWENNLDNYVATGERSQALSALMDPAFPLMMSTATDRFSFVGPTNLDLSDEAGINYLKALPVNRKTRRRLHQTRWIVHLYDGKNQTTATYLRQLESETTTVLEIDLQRSRILNMKGWNNVIRALLWAACRGQVEGVIGGPPRDDQDELKKKLMYLWMVAEQGAKKDGLRKPFLFMELPENHSWWAAEPWRKLKDECQLFNVKVGQGDDKGFYGATNMCFSGNKTPSSKSPSQWTEALVSEIKEAAEQWFKYPDQLRMAQLLCAMNGSLGEMSEAELKKWAKHVRNGHVPFDKRCRTCVINSGTGRPHRRVLNPSAFTLGVDIAGPLRTRGVDADGKYRYALIGSYCLPKVEGYKDMDIPAELEDDGAGVGDVLDDERNFLEEEETVDPPNSIEDQHDLDRRNEDYKRFYKEVYQEVGDSMEYQSLIYVIPLKSRLKTDVNTAMRKLYLSLRQEGHPVVRVHSDRARELKSASLRQWLYEKDIWVTTGESQTPQQNGRAEAAVKLLKRYAKVLLDAGGLPRECWPLAMSYAAHRQRQRALGQPCNDPPFGATVAVKSKVFGTGGSYDLDPRWREGKFVGRSSDVTNGLVVRYDDGSFVTSCHVRQGLVNADAIVEPEPVEVDLPAPSRRLREKVRLAAIHDRYEEVENYAREMMAAEAYREEDVLNLWTMLKELPRPRRRGLKMADIDKRAESFYTGSYVHGGVCGIMKMTRRMPSTTMYLVKAAKELTGINEFGCVAIVEDVGMKAHKDSHNEHSTQNSVTALTEFEDGQIWVEKREEEFQYDDEWRQVQPNLWVRGSPRALEKGSTVSFPPGQWHSTEPWNGRRVVMLTYTPRLSHMSSESAEELNSLGFNLPTSSSTTTSREEAMLNAMDVGESHGRSMFEPPEAEFGEEDAKDGWASSVSRLIEDQQDLIDELQDRALVLRRLLEEEEILLEEYRRKGHQVNDEADHAHQMLVDLIEQTGDTMKHLESEQESRWLKTAVQAQDGDAPEDVEKYLRELEGDLQVVLTVPLEQVKRNLQLWVPAIDKELTALFKDGENGTLKRIPLSEAKKREASGELTILPSKLVFTIKPPSQSTTTSSTSKDEKRERWRRKCRLVLCGNFAARPEGQDQSELYASGATSESLRVALVLASCCSWVGAGSDITTAFLLAPWPRHLRRYSIVPAKTLVLAGLASGEEAWEVQRALYGLRESPAVWSEYRRQRLLQADVPWAKGKLILKPSVVDPEVWMIVYQVNGEQDTLVGVLVTYVDDLLYLAESAVITAVHSWLSKEWPSAPLEWTKEGTRYLGVEILQKDEGFFLISQRGYLENLVRSYELEPGQHVRLPCPREWLIDEDSPVEEEQYTEAELKRAQKVTGELLWVTRSRPDVLFVTSMMASALSKRPCHVYRVGLKVMAYLASTLEVQLQLGGVAALVQEIVGTQVAQSLLVDNAAAVSLISGCQGSWRTRHLKVRCSFITDLFKAGALAVKHVCGKRQLADLPTKLHSKERLNELMTLWGFIGLLRVRLDDRARLTCLLCLIVALQIQPVRASQDIPLVGFNELLLATLVVCIAAVGLWELGKKLGKWLCGMHDETPKERRLRRLREVARNAAEEELDKQELRKELEAEAESLKRSPTTRDPISSATTTRNATTQTPPMPDPQVEIRTVYRDIPRTAPADIPVTQFWKTTDHRSKVLQRRVVSPMMEQVQSAGRSDDLPPPPRPSGNEGRAVLPGMPPEVDRGRSLIFDCGGIPTLLEAMRRCSASADVQESCCKILKAQMREHLLKESALEMVINAMKNHVQHGRVQVGSSSPSMSMLVVLLQELARQGALRATLAAMKSQSAVAKVQALSVAIHEHDVPEVQKAGSAARQRLAVRGFRLSQFQTQLVRPSIVKRRRHFASFCGREMHENAVEAARGSRPVSVARLGPSRFQIAGREVAVQIRNDQVLVQQGQVFVPMAKYLSTIGLLGGTANGSVTPRGSGSGGGRHYTSQFDGVEAAPTKAKAASPKSGSPIAKVGAAVPKPGPVKAKLLKQRHGSRTQDQMLWNEILQIHIQLSQWSMVFLMFAGGGLITAAQLFFLSGSDPGSFWLSKPQLWTILSGVVIVYLFTFVPVRYRSYTVHAFYITMNCLALIMLLPSHCPRDQLLRTSMTAVIIFRVPSILLTPRTLLVLAMGSGYVLMSFIRFTLEPVPRPGGCAVDEQFKVRMELYALLATTFLSFMVKLMVKRKVELSVDGSNLAKQLSAASSLLKLTCDAVIELDDNLRLTEHSPELSALLLHRPGFSTKEKRLTDFMKPDDATRATQILCDGPSSYETQISAHAFHTRLVDSCSSKLCAEVFQVKYTKHDGKEYSLLGLRDFTDVKPLSGGNALDAFDSTVSTELPLSPLMTATLANASSCDDRDDRDLKADDASSVSAASSSEESLKVRPRTVYMDVDTEGMLIHAASSPVMALSGSSLADVFPSPHTRLLLEQLRREADLFRSRGEEPPGRVLNYEDMPVILNPGTVDRITGTMQITQEGGLATVRFIEAMLLEIAH
ncbi:Copia protein [Symbiodinium microadriaticum]|uniref:Copia protein n=1 Tax=Symbiodinium microadriaticum TaxID=2951 RepID=A0A1Q9EHR0_SYMMI|nr:Copia protein [Symbiodinium microadriaticum]